jgi:hypothetical protein
LFATSIVFSDFADVTGLSEARRMLIVNATYGKLGDMKKSMDVTKQIQALVNQQGGDRLELKAGAASFFLHFV